MHAEYEAAMKTIGFFDFSMEGKILIKGPGRIDFINGLVSNDVKLLKENQGCYAAFLNKSGKILSDCTIYKFPDFLLLNMNLIGKKNIIDILKNEAALGKCEVEDVSLKYALFSLQGPQAVLFLEQLFGLSIELPTEYENTILSYPMDSNATNSNATTDSAKDEKNSEVIVARHSRTKPGGFDLFIPSMHYKQMKQKTLEIRKSLGIQEISNDTYEMLRLEAKKPVYGIDFDQANILPEISEKMASYTKGCYVGQEIVVRVKNLAKGLTSKRLSHFEIQGNELPKKNDKIMHEDKEAGHITSAAFSYEKNKVLAFGFLKKDFFDKSEFEILGMGARKS